ncbi:MAG: hypothetical protein NVSMB65_02960 [Chloroflexota bacterium]
MVLLLQPALDEAGNAYLILHYQEPHGSPLRAGRKRAAAVTRQAARENPAAGRPRATMLHDSTVLDGAMPWPSGHARSVGSKDAHQNGFDNGDQQDGDYR